MFEPVKIEVTIESEQELCNLWHRLNLPVLSVNKNLFKENYIKCDCNDDGTSVLFCIVDDIAINFNN